MYAPFQLYGEIAAHDGSNESMDLQTSRMAHFLAAAGWSLRAVGHEFILTTLGDMSESFTLAGFSTYIFWRVINNISGKCRLVGDEEHANDEVNNLCDAPLIVTGSRDIVPTHAGVVLAVQQLTGWTPIPITPTSTRFRSGAASSSEISLSFGASLNTIMTVPGGGGYVCRSQPSRNLRLDIGDDNFVEVFISREQVGAQPNVWVQGSKNFAERPQDSGTSTNTVTVDTSIATPRGCVALVNEGPIAAVANPYSAMFWNTESTGFLYAGGLKLPDLRGTNTATDAYDIYESTLIGHTSGGAEGEGWITHPMFRGCEVRVAINETAGFLEDTGGNGAPLLVCDGKSASGASQVSEGMDWVTGEAPLSEPWVTANPFNLGAEAPIIGQAWDLALAWRLLDESTDNLVNWDGKKWKIVGGSTFSFGAGDNKQVYTLLARVTNVWDGSGVTQ